MANDDNSSDQFIREVDEELRRDALTALWKRYGRYVIAACVLVVAMTAGLRGYDWWQAKQAADRGDAYLAAMDTRQNGDREAARAQFDTLAESGGGYGILARFQNASGDADAGDPVTALAAYDALAADTTIDSNLRDLARLRAALVALDNNDGPGATSRIEGLAVSGNPWRHSAREILGTVAYSDGQLEEARTLFSQVQSDAESPTNLRERATVMISLIDGQLTSVAGDTQ